MVEVRLWAPLASSAEAVVADARHDMAPAAGGHWTIDLPEGTDYLLSVDGGEPRPDPRSAHQPHGVHGPSRTFDATGFAWTDAGAPGVELLGSVYYELHVGTFTPEGTLDAAIGRLDHLVDLGVAVVELMPVAAFPGVRGWGYDGVALYAVHDAYGGPEALQRFVDAAHSRGLAVCLDVVYNHFGPSGNYAPTFAPYFTDKHHTPWGAAINLDDEHSDGVRAFIVDNALRWLRDFHVDALRLDAVHALADDSPTHLLAELARAVDAARPTLGRPVALIAESDLNLVSTITPLQEGGLGLDAQWADDVHHALHAYLTGETFGYYADFGSPEALAKALERVFVHDGGHSTFRGVPWGAPVPDHVDRRRFVACTQNHDQVGNRGLGDRPDERLPAGTVAGGAALLLLSPFTPMLFQGQEWGTARPFRFFTDHDPDLGALVTKGRLAEFAGHGWDDLYGPGHEVPDPQAGSTFTDSVLDWSEPDADPHAEMLAWHRRLITLRREHLGGGTHRVRCAYGDGWFTMAHGPVTVAVAPRAAASVPGSPGRLVASFGDAELTDTAVQLGPHAVAVLVG